MALKVGDIITFELELLQSGMLNYLQKFQGRRRDPSSNPR